MNRDALAYLQVGRAALSHKQTLSWTMHVLLRKFPSNAKFLEDDTSDRCNNTTAAQPRTPKLQAGRLQNHYAETLWNKQNVASQIQLHTSPWLLLGKHTRTNVCAKPLKQRTKHHVQGRSVGLSAISNFKFSNF